jgi:hypothetical protein
VPLRAQPSIQCGDDDFEARQDRDTRMANLVLDEARRLRAVLSDPRLPADTRALATRHVEALTVALLDFLRHAGT